MRSITSLIFGEDHRDVAMEAKNFCTQSSLLDDEFLLINKYKLDKEVLIKKRNLGHIDMFIGIFQGIGYRKPDSLYGLTGNYFKIYCEGYYELGRGLAMWEDQVESFTKSISNNQTQNFSPSIPLEFHKLVKRYHSDCLQFFDRKKKFFNQSITEYQK